MHVFEQPADHAFVILDDDRLHLVTIEPASVLTLDLTSAMVLAESMGAAIGNKDLENVAMLMTGQFSGPAAELVLDWMRQARSINASAEVAGSPGGGVAACLSVQVDVSVSMARGHRALAPQAGAKG